MGTVQRQPFQLFRRGWGPLRAAAGPGRDPCALPRAKVPGTYIPCRGTGSGRMESGESERVQEARPRKKKQVKKPMVAAGFVSG